MTESSNIIRKLQNQNYLLKQQLQDIKNKYANLKKQHQIWQQINTHQQVQLTSQKQKQYETQASYYKQQVISIANEKHHLETCLEEAKQKIKDLKYSIQELKQMNEKQANLHQKQIQLTKRNNLVNVNDNQFTYKRHGINKNLHQEEQNDRYQNIIQDLSEQHQNNLERIRQLEERISEQILLNSKNQQKLTKCSQIAKQMEEYYNSELQRKDELIAQLQEQLLRLRQHCQNFQTEGNSNSQSKFMFSLGNSQLRNSYKMIGLHRDKGQQQQMSLKCSSIVSEYQKSDKMQSSILAIEQKYENVIMQMKYHYEKQVSKYQDKVKYLILKVESLQEQLSRCEQEDTSSININNQAPFYYQKNKNNQSKVQPNIHGNKSVNNVLKNSNSSLTNVNSDCNKSFEFSTRKMSGRNTDLKCKRNTTIVTPQKHLKTAVNSNRQSSGYIDQNAEFSTRYY